MFQANCELALPVAPVLLETHKLVQHPNRLLKPIERNLGDRDFAAHLALTLFVTQVVINGQSLPQYLEKFREKEGKSVCVGKRKEKKERECVYICDVCVCVHMCGCVRTCVCVCVKEREKEKERVCA